MGTPVLDAPQPFFSILVNLSDCVDDVRIALDSVISQSDPDWEALIVETPMIDGATAAVAKSYAASDPRIVLLRQGTSVCAALNIGLEKARGDWVCCLSTNAALNRNRLELYRQEIKRHPQCKFFYNAVCRNAANIRCLDPGADVPPSSASLHLVALLGADHVDGNTVCVERKAWLAAGGFDEAQRSAHQYEMWLRLMSRVRSHFSSHSTIIAAPRGACDAGYTLETRVAAGTAAIEFINKHTFEELLPWVEFDRPTEVIRALARTLRIATSPLSIIYCLGAHPALILRICEWAWSVQNKTVFRIARAIVRRRAFECSKRYPNTPFGSLWHATFVAARLSGNRFEYQQVVPSEIGRQAGASTGNAETAVTRTLGQAFKLMAGGNTATTTAATTVKDVLLVNQIGMKITGGVAYGALRATLEVSKALMGHGVPTTLVSVANTRLALREGVVTLGASNERQLLRTLRLWGRAHTVVGISRGDFVRKVNAERAVIYHHNPNAVEGFPLEKSLTRELNRAAITTICVSNFGKALLSRSGLRSELIKVVPNGVDRTFFRRRGNSGRQRHSIVFVGHIVDYKGFDIALRAFKSLRMMFPDASFNAYGAPLVNHGRAVSWRRCADQLLEPSWLDADGLPLWTVIEREVAGFRYWGEVTQEQLADALTTQSILVMPSRITETFGLVSLEAQACGCIPILPNGSGFAETLQDGVTGYLYSSNSVEALVQKIASLWRRHLPAEAQRTTARQWVMSNFSWETTGNRFVQCVEAAPKIGRYTRVRFQVAWLVATLQHRVRQISTKLRARLETPCALASVLLPAIGRRAQRMFL